MSLSETTSPNWKARFKRWFHSWASPKWFYEKSERWLPWLSIPAVLLILTGLVWGLLFAPQDYQQGNSFRIFYLHVPAAFLSQSIFMMMAIAGGINLVWRIKLADMAAKHCAPIGASFAVLALATGAIWGKPTWGAWWVWDARLTAMLILLFLYLGVIALYSAIDNRETAGRSTAVLSLVGLVNIPIIKYSVEWWNTLHQPATFKLTEKPAMPFEMWFPALLVVLGCYLFFGWMLFKRMRAEVVEREFKAKWLQDKLRNS
jgi:heme exporter protein C